MSKNKKKEKKNKAKQKNIAGGTRELQATVDRLRQENEQLRARLESIAELAGTPLPQPDYGDVEDEEYEELSRDVDDEIADGEAAKETASTDGLGRS